MGHYCHACGGTRPNEKFSGRGHAKHICRDCEIKARAARRAKLRESPPAAPPILKHTWGFKRYLRANAFGWSSSPLACKRLGEATKDVMGIAKHNPVLAGDGGVALCERIWPAFQSVDSSTGALGTAVNKATAEMVSLLIGAPASDDVRRRWLDSLFKAAQEDGVDYLCNLRESWGRLCGSPNLAGEWADHTLSVVQRTFSEREAFAYTSCDSICLSCLLESGRYDDMRSLLDLARTRFWHSEKYWAEALKRQRQVDDALAYAESLLKESINDGRFIVQFCEALLIEAEHEEEAYKRYALMLQTEPTYLNRYRAIKRRYPNRDPRGILLDLIGVDDEDEPGHWFAAAFRSGYADIALDCAQQGVVDPKTSSGPRSRAETEIQHSRSL